MPCNGFVWEREQNWRESCSDFWFFWVAHLLRLWRPNPPPLDKNPFRIFFHLMLSFSPPFAPLSINSSSHCWVPGAIRWYLPHQGVFTAQDPWGPAKDHANGSSVRIGWCFRYFLIAGTFWGGGSQWHSYRGRASGKRGWARGWAEQLGGAQKRWRFTGHQQMRLTGKWMAWRPDVSPQNLHDLHLLSCLCYDHLWRT